MARASEFWLVAAPPALVGLVAPLCVVADVPPVVAEAAVTVKTFPASDHVNVVAPLTGLVTSPAIFNTVCVPAAGRFVGLYNVPVDRGA